MRVGRAARVGDLLALADAAPSVWQARVAELETLQTQVEADVQHISTTLRRIELLITMIQTRTALLQGERERALIYLVAGLGVALLVVLIADTNPARMAIRLVLLALVIGGAWAGWRSWQQSRPS